MNLLRKTYLYKLLIADRKLFVALMAFIALQLFFTYKGVETLPFVNYGMYSAVSHKSPVYSMVAVTWNDSLSLPGKMTNATDHFYSILEYYATLHQSGFHDPLVTTVNDRLKKLGMSSFSDELMKQLINMPGDEERFYIWLNRYMEDAESEPVKKWCIHDYSFRWDEGRFFLVSDSALVVHDIIYTKMQRP